jgi:hypothetical protein
MNPFPKHPIPFGHTRRLFRPPLLLRVLPILISGALFLLPATALEAQGGIGRGSGVRAPQVRALEVSAGVDEVRRSLLGRGYVAELAYLSSLTPSGVYRVGISVREGTDAEPCLVTGRPLPCAEGDGLLEVVGLFIEPRRTLWGSEPDDRIRLEAGTRISIERLRNGWDQDGFGFAGVGAVRFELTEAVHASVSGQVGLLWFANALLPQGLQSSGIRGTLRAGLAVKLP